MQVIGYRQPFLTVTTHCDGHPIHHKPPCFDLCAENNINSVRHTNLILIPALHQSVIAVTTIRIFNKCWRKIFKSISFCCSIKIVLGEISVCGRCGSGGYSDMVKHPPSVLQLLLSLPCLHPGYFPCVLQTAISMWGRGYWRILRYHRPLPTIRPPSPLASFSTWESLDFFLSID